jgi:replication-associated recombination protein RarA
MSSVSSASKLDGLRGLVGVKRILRSLFTEDHGVHSVLLHGSEGSGKTTVARILAQSLYKSIRRGRVRTVPSVQRVRARNERGHSARRTETSKPYHPLRRYPSF